MDDTEYVDIPARCGACRAALTVLAVEATVILAMLAFIIVRAW